MYEYIYLAAKSMSLNEFITTINDYGEEGYRYLPQENFGVAILEREVLPEMTAISAARITPYPLYAQAAVVMLALIVFLLVFFMVAGGLHWMR